MIDTDRRTAILRRTIAPGAENDVTPSDAWKCVIVPNPPGAALIVECRSAAGARHVSVLLDGVPAPRHPTVYVASEDPDLMTAGAEAEYLFVLTRGRPQFDRVEIAWTDAGTGTRHRLAMDARDITL